MGPYTGTETGVVVKPKDSRSKRAQPCEDMPFLGARQKELCNQVCDIVGPVCYKPSALTTKEWLLP